MPLSFEQIVDGLLLGDLSFICCFFEPPSFFFFLRLFRLQRGLSSLLLFFPLSLFFLSLLPESLLRLLLSLVFVDELLVLLLLLDEILRQRHLKFGFAFVFDLLLKLFAQCIQLLLKILLSFLFGLLFELLLLGYLFLGWGGWVRLLSSCTGIGSFLVSIICVRVRITAIRIVDPRILNGRIVLAALQPGDAFVIAALILLLAVPDGPVCQRQARQAVLARKDGVRLAHGALGLLWLDAGLRVVNARAEAAFGAHLALLAPRVFIVAGLAEA